MMMVLRTRNYVVHSIVGQEGKDVETSVPWLATEAVATSTCGGDSEAAGVQHQELNIPIHVACEIQID